MARPTENRPYDSSPLAQLQEAHSRARRTPRLRRPVASVGSKLYEQGLAERESHCCNYLFETRWDVADEMAGRFRKPCLTGSAVQLAFGDSSLGTCGCLASERTHR